MTKRHILTFETFNDWDTEPMEAQYVVHNLPHGADFTTLSQEAFDNVEAFAFRGHSVLSAQIMDAFPKLGMIASYGVGYDTIDVSSASSKGIKVSNTPDVLTEDVADLAVGIIIAASRGIVGAAGWVKSGNWVKNGSYTLQRKVSGKKIGIVGLGRIGRAIAERMQPFGCEIHYYSRSPKTTPNWQHHGDIIAMAFEVDILVVTLSGGPDTTGMVGAEEFKALGAEGLLVNVSRGTTIDETALLDALENGTIRGAGLDVFDNEPNINRRFLALDNVLLQPHHSSGTVETRKAMGQLQRDNLAAYFAGTPLLSPVG